MSGITPKPFNLADKMAGTTFLPNPNVFTIEDVNRETARLDAYSRQISQQVGLLRENLNVGLNSAVDSLVSGNNQVVVSITISQITGASPSYIYFKGIRFVVPLGSPTYTGTFRTASPAYPSAYLCLYAQRVTKDFTADPIMCGVNSDEFPTSIPSTDNDVYGSETLILTDTPSVSTPTGFELIGIVATIAPHAGSTYNSVIGTYGLPIPNPSGAFTRTLQRTIMYNALIVSDVLNKLPFQVTNVLFSAYGLTPDASGTTIQNNASMADMWAYLSEYFGITQNTIKQMFNWAYDNTNNIYANLAALTTIVNDALAASAAATALANSLREVPMGGIMLYEGNFSEFSVNGLGIVGDKDGFAICNGDNGTTDLRGLFVVGAINGVPASADPIRPNTNPSVSGNPNYSMGDVGGLPNILLTVDNLPAHIHPITSDPGHVHLHSDPGYQEVNVQSGSGVTVWANGTLDIEALPASTGITTTDVNVTAHTTVDNRPPWYALAYIKRIS